MNTNGYRNDSSSRGYSAEDPLPAKKNLSLGKFLFIGLVVFIVGSLAYNYLSEKTEKVAEKTEERCQPVSEKHPSDTCSDTKTDKGDDLHKQKERVKNRRSSRSAASGPYFSSTELEEMATRNANTN